MSRSFDCILLFPNSDIILHHHLLHCLPPSAVAPLLFVPHHSPKRHCRMGSGSLTTSLLFFFFLAAFCLFHSASSDDASDQLFQGINKYRASLNLPALTENKNAACLADQIVTQFKDQPCTNSTGSSTVPGTEQQFPNYPDFLDHCHLNASVTQDGAVLPACVLRLDAALVLTNFTKSQYSRYLNDTQFVGAGIASEGNWIVAVLSTNTPAGAFATFTGASSFLKFSPWYPLASLLLGSFMVI